MDIKTKLGLGVGLLFILLMVSITVGIRYMAALAGDTQNILEDNYKTLEYTRQMLMVLDENINEPSNRALFETNLRNQQNNITEPGEKELTDQLRRDFENLLTDTVNTVNDVRVRKDLTAIMRLNMVAIERKSAVAETTATKAKMIMAIVGAICFIISFILLMNLPSSIAKPIQQLNESIKEISAKNYGHRLHLASHNEFGELADSFNKMAQKLDGYNHSNLSKLMMEKKRIETLINNMHDPVIGLDEQMKIIFINHEALKVTGIRAEESLGKSVKELAKQNDLIRTLIQDLPAGESLTTANDVKPIKIYADGKESYFDKEIISIDQVPAGETQSQHIGDVILLKNITAFKELDVAKTNFIATVSHELKTPISSLMMSLQLLENEKTGQINEAQKQLIESVKEDSGRLLKITGELLNFTQLDTGNIQLSIKPSDPQKILDYALEAVKTQADQKELKINVQASSQLPPVKADAEKTAWVIVNLLTNAIRYSPEKSEIKVGINKTENSSLKFSIQDFGNGIEEKYLNKIFDRYFQVPGSHKSGTGLGLAISKEFIEAQGGKIWAESSYGSGSTFYFTLNV